MSDYNCLERRLGDAQKFQKIPFSHVMKEVLHATLPFEGQRYLWHYINPEALLPEKLIIEAMLTTYQLMVYVPIAAYIEQKFL